MTKIARLLLGDSEYVVPVRDYKNGISSSTISLASKIFILLHLQFVFSVATEYKNHMIRVTDLRQSISKYFNCNFKFPRELCLFMYSLDGGVCYSYGIGKRGHK